MDADFFTQEDLIDDNMLYKMEIYVPAIIEAMDLVVAELKNKRGKLLNKLWHYEQAVLPQKQAQIMMVIDKKMYTNADLREARTTDDKQVKEIMDQIFKVKQEITQAEHEVNQWLAKTWRYKNLQNNLDNISKLRVSERKY